MTTAFFQGLLWIDLQANPRRMLWVRWWYNVDTSKRISCKRIRESSRFFWIPHGKPKNGGTSRRISVDPTRGFQKSMSKFLKVNLCCELSQRPSDFSKDDDSILLGTLWIDHHASPRGMLLVRRGWNWENWWIFNTPLGSSRKTKGWTTRNSSEV